MTDLDATLTAHARATDAFATRLRTVSAEQSIPHLAWTAGELGAHVLAGIRGYERAATHGEDLWSDLMDGPAQNARLLERTPERETSLIADRIPAAVASLHEVWRRVTGPVRWSGGLTLPVEVVAGINLADVLVHGWDLASVVAGRWRIARTDAVLVLRAIGAIAPHFVAPEAQGFSGAYEIRLRGDGRVVFAFDDGTLRIDPADDQRIDCRLSADPAVFLLASYGRIPVWRTALTGAVIASGRKPWLAFRFKSLLSSP